MCPKNAESSQCQTLRGWQQHCSVTRLNLTTQMIPAQTLVSVLVWRMTKKSSTETIVAQEEKMSMESPSSAFQPHSHVAMALLNQLNSRTTCIEMFEKRSLSINRKVIFSRHFSWNFELLPKKCQRAFSAKTTQLLYNQQFPIKDFWDLRVWGF